MKTLLSQAMAPDGRRIYVTVEGEYITYSATERPEGDFQHVIDCRNMLISPGFYNCHTHAAMTLFRGYGEDMPLDRWLHDRIFPAEDRLTDRAVYNGSMLAIAEMLRGGTVSFSDMYFFCENTVHAALEAGIKANISRSVVSFDESADPRADSRVAEAEQLFRNYHNSGDGRIKIDMALHAEYTNTERFCRHVADFAAANGARMHLHLSETESEHEQGKLRRKMTPAAFFAQTGCFDMPALAAHCVWVDDDDIALMRDHGVVAVHNPVSNLKLGSGIMRFSEMLDGGVKIALGTDGAASNNRLDLLREAQTAALLCKGVTRDPGGVPARRFIEAATREGALAQGRDDCGRIEPGYRADLVLLSLDSARNIPVFDPAATLLYSAEASDVYMTMVDGRILYENGEYYTLDIERVKYEMRQECEHYFEEK